MNISDNVERSDERVLIDRNALAASVDYLIKEDPVAAESFARLAAMIREAIESGPEGVERARNTLIDAIELAYLYTSAHRAALELYLLSLQGDLNPHDEPLNLIKAAIERGRSESKSLPRFTDQHAKRTRSKKT